MACIPDNSLVAPQKLEPIWFETLDGWNADMFGDVFPAFLKSCRRIVSDADTSRPGPLTGSGMASTCRAAMDLGSEAEPAQIRAFFETYFTPHRIAAPESALTAYYEPVVDGARERAGAFRYPLYKRPPDLAADTDSTGSALEPFLTRSEIDDGGLAGRDLELIWLADPVDAYFVHIQGSARIRLRDGSLVRIGFDGKNGHPYRSVGKAMLAAGVITPEQATADDMKAWMRANPDAAKRFMQANPSYVFFREDTALDQDSGPVGGEGVPLTAGRSLAVDRAHYAYGLPFWIEANLPVAGNGGFERFNRLMIAQDTGAAIKGAARGDIFWGTGPEAGSIAGRVHNPGRFHVLLPCGTPADGTGK